MFNDSILKRLLFLKLQKEIKIDSASIVCLQAKKSKNAFFGDFRPPVENAHSIGTFHMFPDSISFFGSSENGQKWDKIGFLYFLTILYLFSVYRHFLTTIRIRSQHA